MLVVSLKSNLGCEAGCGLTVSCMVGSWSDHSGIVPAFLNDVASVFKDFLRNIGVSFFVAAQYLVRLEGDTFCSPHCQ